MTRDWLPDVCGILVNLLTLGWIADEQLGRDGVKITRIKCRESLTAALARDENAAELAPVDRASMNACLKLVAIMIAGESAEITAVFVRALTATVNWTPDRVTELVSFLDAVLEWDERYFRDFTQCYVELSKNDQAAQTSNSDDASGPESQSALARHARDNKSGKLSFDYLAALYKTNLALANYKLALADFKLALTARGSSDRASQPVINNDVNADALDATGADASTSAGETHSAIGSLEFVPSAFNPSRRASLVTSTLGGTTSTLNDTMNTNTGIRSVGVSSDEEDDDVRGASQSMCNPHRDELTLPGLDDVDEALDHSIPSLLPTVSDATEQPSIQIRWIQRSSSGSSMG